MTTETGSPAGSEAFELPADAPEEFSSVSDALSYLTSLDEKRKESPAESADEATADPELSTGDRKSDTDNSDPVMDPAEATEDAEPDENPPIERPRSWTKDEDAEWQSLPRATQQKIVAREQERDTGLRRSQNEAAEDRKAAKAERENAEKAKQQYEAQLPALMQTLQNAQQAAFSDIKTMDDVIKLQAEDPFRFQSWQVHQMQLQAAKAETDRVTKDRETAEQSKWADYVNSENAKAAELIPDLADKTRAEKLNSRVARELLPELGFSDSELNALASGREKLPIYDHRVQKLLADALKLKDIQSAPKAIAAKPLPSVSRPGTSRPAGSDASEREQALTRKPELSLKEANELYALQSRRRA